MVSIIIPCYNLGKYLEDAIESVLQQTYQDFEIIVVNDGSDDPYTLQLLDKRKWPKTKIFHTRNMGASYARNYGIEKAQGEFICCLDADDKLHPTYLEKTRSHFLNDTKGEIGIVTTWVQEFGLSCGIWKTRNYDPVSLLYQNELHVASLFRRQCWVDCGGYSENVDGYEDWDFWIKIIACSWKWDVCEEILFFYRKRLNSKLLASQGRRAELYELIISNNRVFFEQHFSELLLRFIDAEEKREMLINEIQQSYPYRIGDILLYIPRLVRRFVLHGFNIGHIKL